MATGTFAIASKLPGLDASVGTAAHPEPNWPDIIIDGEADAIGALADMLGAPPALSPLSVPPQADRASTAITPTEANRRRFI
ncbi:hypothetical protein [Micromonospora sp. bgisy143]|uniref:hypothetical protein n=1 Tax=Micromonospora sp. bgisy143 TaxID=3413790 RepID=UPI003EBA0AF7